MKPNSIESDVKQYLEGIIVPDMDASDKVMNRINQTGTVKRYSRLLRAAAIPLAMIMTISVVFAGTQLWKELFKLKDKKGNIVYLKAS